MANSMTGYGRGEIIRDEQRVQVEIRSVNSRYADIFFRMPSLLAEHEVTLRNLAKKYLKRGKVEVKIEYENFAPTEINMQLDEGLARAYMDSLRRLEKITGDKVENMTVELARKKDLFITRDAAEVNEEIGSILAEAMLLALTKLVDMRLKEGQYLVADIQSKIDALAAMAEQIVAQAENMVDEYRAKLMARVDYLLGEDVEEYYNGQRIAAEVTLYADRVAIDEELVRLHSHLLQFGQIMNADGAIGKKLDFMCQEINREINTIGSKANHSDITTVVVDMKTTLEKIREQVQNIE